jgi:L-ribulose-5-phosphate 3-epimerase UlaE
LLKPFIRSIDIKDFQWSRSEGKWAAEVVPLGEGMVDFKNYFAQLKQQQIRVPISMHYEYSLGGAEHGHRELTIDGEQVIDSMKRDLNVLRGMLITAGI